MSLTLLITIALIVWAAAMVVMVVLQRRSPAATISWLLVLTLLPIVGWGIYQIIGPQRLARLKLKRRINRSIADEASDVARELEAAEPGLHRAQLARIAFGVGEAPPLRANDVTLYTEGDDAYTAIAEAIANAKHHIHLEYYIWENDATGRKLAERLLARAQAGVKVRIIVDGMGARGVRGKFFAPLLAAGAEVAWFNPVSLWHLRRRRADLRTHRKIVICDGRIGFTGGMNIANCHSAMTDAGAAWRDSHVRITGSAVRALQRLFNEDWLYTSGHALPRDPLYFPSEHGPQGHSEHIVQIIGSGPDTTGYAIKKFMFAAINQAVERVWLTTPYFIPDESVLAALMSAALRGIDVRVLVPQKGDSRLVDLAARSYFPELIDAGVKIYQYQPRFIHAKTLVVDQDIALVGTANCDLRSFHLNFEVVAVMYGDNIPTELAAVFTHDLANAKRVTQYPPPKHPFGSRLGEASARLLSPLL